MIQRDCTTWNRIRYLADGFVMCTTFARFMEVNGGGGCCDVDDCQALTI